MGRPATSEAMFWAKVDRQADGCWLYTGKSGNRYGHKKFSLYNRGMSAHRYAWIVTNGEITEGLCVLHGCDTPACVRPSHLFLGTNYDNTQDARTKGRLARGERHGLAKIDAAAAIEIKTRIAAGQANKEIAEATGFPYNCIANIRYNKTWSHV